MEIKKILLNKSFAIAVLLIIILILLFTSKFRCTTYDNRTILDKLDKSVCGNKECEQGAESYSSCAIDCPNCNDNNKCTSDFFNYNTQKCENNLIYSCCGNKLCEKGESLTECPLDCQSDISPIDIGRANYLKINKLYDYNNRVLEVDSIWTDSILIDISYKGESIPYRIYKGRTINVFDTNIELVDIEYSTDSSLRTALIKVY